ncbi:MAG: hypothetical protein ACTSRU_00875 [Candidatus Hodarchaeales archaeon]
MVNTFLEAEKAVTLNDLRQATGACYFDTREVLQILEYITSFGKITMNDNTWVIETPEEKIKSKRPRRYHYIEGIIEIIELLSNGPKSLDELVRETKISQEKLAEVLPFFSSITSAGFLSSNGII